MLVLLMVLLNIPTTLIFILLLLNYVCYELMCTTLQLVSITAHISTDTFPIDPIMLQVLRVVCADNALYRNG